MNVKLVFCEQGMGQQAFPLGKVTAAAARPVASDKDKALPIDLASLLRRCLDDTNFCAMILHKFAARSQDQLAALERALESGNTVELAREAHTLMGVAANLSAQSLRDWAEQLERAARRGDLITARSALEHTKSQLLLCAQQVPQLMDQLRG